LTSVTFITGRAFLTTDFELGFVVGAFDAAFAGNAINDRLVLASNTAESPRVDRRTVASRRAERPGGALRGCFTIEVTRLS
jgi:hypothetical protein